MLREVGVIYLVPEEGYKKPIIPNLEFWVR